MRPLSSPELYPAIVYIIIIKVANILPIVIPRHNTVNKTIFVNVLSSIVYLLMLAI